MTDRQKLTRIDAKSIRQQVAGEIYNALLSLSIYQRTSTRQEILRYARRMALDGNRQDLIVAIDAIRRELA